MAALRGILFDKDDTLIDLETFWRVPVEKTAARAVQLALGRPDGALTRALEEAAGFRDGRLIPESPVVAGTNTDVVNACAGVLEARGVTLPPDWRQAVDHTLETACLTCGEVVPRVPLLPALEELRRRGIVLGVATSDNYAPTVHCLEKLGVAGYFSDILSADRVAHPKPHPDSALQFCRRHGLAPGEVAMVGDSVNDMRFARNSGLVGLFFRPEGWIGPLPAGARCSLRRLEELPGLGP